MTGTGFAEADWAYVLSLLPSNLEQRAADTLAIRRRREVDSAETLLRLALVYSVCDFSLRQTAAWAKAQGVASLSDVALLKRLRGASTWLGELVVAFLRERGLTSHVPGLVVRVVDASVVMAPGGVGVDWRVHLRMDLAACRIADVELTGPEGGETLVRHHVDAGDVLVVDRGYAHRKGVASVLDRGGHVVVRSNWQNFPLESRRGESLDAVRVLETLAPGEIGDWDVQFNHEGAVYPVRLVAIPKSTPAVERERREIRAEARRKQRQPDPRSLRAASFMYVVTDLSRDVLPALEALELYRLRWQVELAFKRLKSVLYLDHLRAQNHELARSYLLAKLLGALVLDELLHSAPAFSPWGFQLAPAPRQSLALAALGA